MIRFISILLIIFTSFDVFSASVWVVSKDKNRLYIGGTVHVLSHSDYPLPPEYDMAYAASSKVVFETDMAALQSADFQRKTMALMTYQDGRTFKDVLSTESVQALESYFKKAFHRHRTYVCFKTCNVVYHLEFNRTATGGIN